ncbi:MAG: ABC transporter permease [bacterium]
MNVAESVQLALIAVKENKLRAGLTLLSISIGIFTIICIGTLVTSLNKTVTGELSSMGENTFTIQKMPAVQMGGATWRKYMTRKPITYKQVTELKRRMQMTSTIGATASTQGITVEFGEKKTDPNVQLLGTDEQFIYTQKINIDKGRNFSKADIDFNQRVCVIGTDLANKLFNGINPLGKTIKVKNQKYEIIGITESRGAIFGQSLDNYAVIPITEFLKYYTDEWNQSLTIEIEAVSKQYLNYTVDEAIGILRSLRNCKPWEDNSFEVITNEALTEQFASLTSFLTIFGLIIGIIALVAAGVGIMNIMLVSVKERTREIGVRKAVGAKPVQIMLQFIIEAVTLCCLGGFVGIFLGIVFALIIGSLGNLGFALPVGWILLSISFCFIMGITFGAYPAWKAAKLDPIEALRYE